MEKKICLLLVLFSLMLHANMLAQDNLIILMDGGTGYREQSWFSSGSGNELQRDKIKENWDKGKYITSAAYSSQGWFVTMAKNCGYTSQKYHYSSDWPEDWISQCWKDGYYMTTVSLGLGKWFVVMSAGTGYTNQVWTYKAWDDNAAFIKEKWGEGYSITEVAKCNGKWLVVMSKCSDIGRQSYSIRNSYEEISARAKELWNDGYSMQLIEYADGQYFLVAAKNKDGHYPQQSFNAFQGSPKEYISKWWDKGQKIAFVGGGYKSNRGSSSGGGSTYAHNNGGSGSGDGSKTTTRIDPVSGAEVTETEYPNGMVTVTYKKLCTACNGTGKSIMGGFACPACMGSGYITVTYSYHKDAPATGGYYPPVGGGYGGSSGGYGSGSKVITCSGCGGTGKCTACGGTGLMRGEYIYTGDGYFITDCPSCNGTGRCGVCHGKGTL